MRGQRFEVFPRHMGFFPYLWLVYVILPIYNMFKFDSWKMGIGFFLLAVFLFTYRQLYFEVEKRSFMYWLLVQLAVIFILSTWYHPTFMYMGFFSANFIGWYIDDRRFKTAMLIFFLVEAIPLAIYAPTLETADLLVLIPFFLIMLLSPLGFRSLSRRQKLEQELAKANEQIRNLIKGEERMRIARDLHDTLGHTLSLITLKSQLVEKLVTKDPMKAQAEAREIQNTSRAALRQVRELVAEMRTATLPEEIRDARMILDSAGIELVCEGNERLEGIPDLAHNILSLCLRESVTNVVKHSKASQCRIRMETLENEWRMIVADNGVGLPNDSPLPAEGSNGLKGMAERLSLIGGTIEARSNQGTIITIRVPIVIKNENRKEEDTHEHPSGDRRGSAHASGRTGFFARF
ncbi:MULTISPECIES: sensor histidine kinase [Paenibacillus]|uniref:sensor histidine kinase n=1 Tax=Paenibacillus TaxID=44249 RepID=UPI00048F4BB8|nr:sensor histidine kinase [Paenibacillus sp. IHBB 10380]